MAVRDLGDVVGVLCICLANPNAWKFTVQAPTPKRIQLVC
jgi:hypothetical protein